MPSGISSHDDSAAMTSAANGASDIGLWGRAGGTALRGRDLDGTRHAHALAVIADRGLEQAVERDLGTEADEAADLLQVRHPAAHVLERLPVDLFVGHELDRRITVAQAL